MGCFDFISNTLSNISGLKEGREYIIENKMLPKIVQLLLDQEINTHRRIHLAHCLRNLAFEYENHEKTFI